MADVNYIVWTTKTLAERYLNGVRGAVPLANEQFDVIARLVKVNNKPVKAFLDIGSGDGILSLVLLSKYPDAVGVLLDISEHMLKAAQEKLNDFKDHLKFITYDYGNEDWVKKVKCEFPFDVIVSGLSIHHQPDNRKKELFAEIFELLAPGGIFINLEHVSSPTEWVGSLFHDCFVDSLFELHKTKNPTITREQIEDDLYNRPDKDANILAPVEEQCRWLREIGFSDVDCYFKIYELAIFGGRKS
jgi:Methylase involved in ubiquinone/menaquinone biosynthesis